MAVQTQAAAVAADVVKPIRQLSQVRQAVLAS
jgi:hypothetical protein